jgi:ABC-type dipeptide/oligopeptide/nickel transport system permease subunit
MATGADVTAILMQEAQDEEVPSQGRRRLGELFRNAGATTGLGILSVLVLLTLIAPLIAGHNPNLANFLALNQSPSSLHWFGTDYLGRDMWARVLYGGRISLPAGLGVVALGAAIGVPLGLASGYVGGFLDDIVMRLMDILLSFPGIILAIGVIGILSPGLTSAIIAIGITGIPFYARFVRGSTLSMKENEYIAAARVSGTRHVRIVSRHILPNVLGPLVVLGSSNFGYAILATAALSYLGLGTQPPTSDWGVLVSQGYQYMFQAASEVIFPGLAIVLTVLSVNLLADGLTDVLDIRR